MADSDDRFPNAIHALCAALHVEGCNPADVEITLPFDEWWKLYCSISRRYSGLVTYDGRGPQLLDGFRYMGLLFKPGPRPRLGAQLWHDATRAAAA